MKKSWPAAIVRGSADPSAGTRTSSLCTSPVSCRSRTQTMTEPSGVTVPSAYRSACGSAGIGVIGRGSPPTASSR